MFSAHPYGRFFTDQQVQLLGVGNGMKRLSVGIPVCLTNPAANLLFR